MGRQVTHTHTHARTHAHRGFEFDEIPESDKEEFAEWLEGIRSAEEEQEQEQLEQQQAQELETDQQGQNSMDMQQSGSDRGGTLMREGFLRNTFRVAGS